MSYINLKVQKHFYSIKKGDDIYPKKLGMIDVIVYDSNKNKEVAVVAFNETIPKGTIFWKCSYNDITYYTNVIKHEENIKDIAYIYLKSIGLNYE